MASLLAGGGCVLVSHGVLRLIALYIEGVFVLVFRVVALPIEALLVAWILE